MKKIEFDKNTGTFVRREEMQVTDTKEINEIRQSLRIELATIVRQVKSLKRRAEEIKAMLAVLDDKAGLVSPAPVVVEEPQLSSDQNPGPK